MTTTTTHPTLANWETINKMPKAKKRQQQQEIKCLNFLPDTLMNQKDKIREREMRICRSLLACELAPAISMWISYGWACQSFRQTAGRITFTPKGNNNNRKKHKIDNYNKNKKKVKRLSGNDRKIFFTKRWFYGASNETRIKSESKSKSVNRFQRQRRQFYK